MYFYSQQRIFFVQHIVYISIMIWSSYNRFGLLILRELVPRTDVHSSEVWV